MNFFLNDYLVKCDLIYKYNLENIKLIPKIKKIDISLKLTENFKELELGQNSSFNFISLQLFLIIYIFYFCFPYIKYSKSKTSKDTFFLLNSIISDKSLIYSFLDSLFVDNIYKAKNLNFLSLNSVKNNESFLKKKNVLRLKVPLSFFDEINEFASLNNLNIKEFFILLNFSIDNPIFLKVNNSKYFLKNLPYFWVFN